MKSSRITGLHRLEVPGRIDELERLGWLSAADAEILRLGRHVLTGGRADRIVENVVGVFGLPFAIAPNFVVNACKSAADATAEPATLKNVRRECCVMMILLIECYTCLTKYLINYCSQFNIECQDDLPVLQIENDGE